MLTGVLPAQPVRHGGIQPDARLLFGGECGSAQDGGPQLGRIRAGTVRCQQASRLGSRTGGRAHRWAPQRGPCAGEPPGDQHLPLPSTRCTPPVGYGRAVLPLRGVRIQLHQSGRHQQLHEPGGMDRFRPRAHRQPAHLTHPHPAGPQGGQSVLERGEDGEALPQQVGDRRQGRIAGDRSQDGLPGSIRGGEAQRHTGGAPAPGQSRLQRVLCQLRAVRGGSGAHHQSGVQQHLQDRAGRIGHARHRLGLEGLHCVQDSGQQARIPLDQLVVLDPLDQLVPGGGQRGRVRAQPGRRTAQMQAQIPDGGRHLHGSTPGPLGAGWNDQGEILQMLQDVVGNLRVVRNAQEGRDLLGGGRSHRGQALQHLQVGQVHAVQCSHQGGAGQGTSGQGPEIGRGRNAQVRSTAQQGGEATWAARPGILQPGGEQPGQ